MDRIHNYIKMDILERANPLIDIVSSFYLWFWGGYHHNLENMTVTDSKWKKGPDKFSRFMIFIIKSNFLLCIRIFW